MELSQDGRGAEPDDRAKRRYGAPRRQRGLMDDREAAYAEEECHHDDQQDHRVVGTEEADGGFRLGERSLIPGMRVRTEKRDRRMPMLRGSLRHVRQLVRSTCHRHQQIENGKDRRGDPARYGGWDIHGAQSTMAAGQSKDVFANELQKLADHALRSTLSAEAAKPRRLQIDRSVYLP